MHNVRISAIIFMLFYVTPGYDYSSGYYSTKKVAGSLNSVYDKNQKIRDILYTPFDYEPCEKHPIKSDKRVIISLRNLIKQHNSNSKEAGRLEKVGWLEGYVTDKQNDDILLFGRENADWPDLYTDDLLYLLENVRSGEGDPSCSLDPIPANLKEFNEETAIKYKNESFQSYYNRLSRKWGDQKAVVRGVSDNSSIASVMLEADYHMKKISQGLVSLPSVRSILDINLDETSDDGRSGMNQPQMSRFWFKCEKNSPVFQASDDIVMLEFCDVIILTEAQKATTEGKLYDSGETNREAELFARDLSGNLRTAATQVGSFARLENLYRLYALLNVMEFRNDLQEFNSLFDILAETFPYARNYNIPETFPGLTNGKLSTREYQQENKKVIEQRFFFVCGGVHMNSPVTSDRIRQGTPELAELRNQILNSRLQADNMISWQVNVTNMVPDRTTVRKFRYKSIKLPEKWKLPRK